MTVCMISRDWWSEPLMECKCDMPVVGRSLPLIDIVKIRHYDVRTLSLAGLASIPLVLFRSSDRFMSAGSASWPPGHRRSLVAANWTVVWSFTGDNCDKPGNCFDVTTHVTEKSDPVAAVNTNSSAVAVKPRDASTSLRQQRILYYLFIKRS